MADCVSPSRAFRWGLVVMDGFASNRTPSADRDFNELVSHAVSQAASACTDGLIVLTARGNGGGCLSLGSVSLGRIEAYLMAAYASASAVALARDQPFFACDVVFEETEPYPSIARPEIEALFFCASDLSADFDCSHSALLGNRPSSLGPLQVVLVDGHQATCAANLDAHTKLPNAAQMPVSANEAALVARDAEATHTPTALAFGHRSCCLGGTFDHLHAGHKVLLTVAALAATHRMVCGVTGDALLKYKKFATALEPLETRITSVLSFLGRIRNLSVFHVETPEIVDVYGPAGTDPDLQIIIVSEETSAGAVTINDKRAESGLAALAVHVIGLIGESGGQSRDKLSSTMLRDWQLRHTGHSALH